MPSVIQNDTFVDISLLFQIIDLLNDCDDIHDAIRPVLREIGDRLGMHRVRITILDRKTGDIALREAYGSGESDLSSICVPIRWRAETIGVLSADTSFFDSDSLRHDEQILTVIAMMISQAVRLFQAVHEENRRLSVEQKSNFRSSNIIGRSKRMQEVFRLVERVSCTPTAVLLQGESGVGKELVAHAIHNNSPRKNGPFVRVNCSALPDGIMESELFGNEEIAGESNGRKGRFELACGGTIFLDEIGGLSPDMQVKLLRVLQEQAIERVGATQLTPIDVRVTTATNYDLETEVEAGRFRRDLYDRLRVFPIHVPALRDRKTDIPLLIDHFVEKHNRTLGTRIARVSTPAIEMLCGYHWPGNVRELESCLERAAILADGDAIMGRHLPPTLQTVTAHTGHHDGTLDSQLNALEYEIIMEELKRYQGNMTKAANALGITHRMMGLRVKKYGIVVTDYKPPSRRRIARRARGS